MEEIYKGYTIKIVHDDDAESPREWDNLGKMICWHDRYNLGDFNGDINVFDNPQDFIEQLPKSYPRLPLYLYDHSGITMKTTPFGDIFDSGQVGWIYADIESIMKEFDLNFNVKKALNKTIKDKVIKRLQNEVETYDQFLTGDIWGYVIDNKDREDAFDMNSCWGFYGQENALTEAKSLVDWHVKHAPKARDKSISTRGAYK